MGHIHYKSEEKYKPKSSGLKEAWELYANVPHGKCNVLAFVTYSICLNDMVVKGR